MWSTNDCGHHVYSLIDWGLCRKDGVMDVTRAFRFCTDPSIAIILWKKGRQNYRGSSFFYIRDSLFYLKASFRYLLERFSNAIYSGFRA